MDFIGQQDSDSSRVTVTRAGWEIFAASYLPAFTAAPVISRKSTASAIAR